MLKLNYNDNEYHYNSNGWFDGDERVGLELSEKLSMIAYESGALNSTTTEKVSTQKKRTSSKKKIKIFDN